MTIADYNSTLVVPSLTGGEPDRYYFEGQIAETDLRLLMFALARRATDGGHVLFEYVYGADDNGETRSEIMAIGPGRMPKLVCHQTAPAPVETERINTIKRHVRRGAITFDIHGLRDDVAPTATEDPSFVIV